MKRIAIILPESTFLKLERDDKRVLKLFQQRRRSFTHKFLKEITGNKIKYNKIDYVCDQMPNTFQTSRSKGNDNSKEMKPRKCTFCNLPIVSGEDNLFPIWVYDGDPDRFFPNKANRPDTSHNKTEIPMCYFCNMELQNSLESHINKHFTMVVDKAFFAKVEFILI